ncbi:DUF413 domain-containing protein [Shewanella glacialipiscicola]|uniref:DUF413 domain-containing protein n=1 Tax=Shewanella glacialipiscicola TaxID=614069 RepID=UPI0021DB4306|nr:DUF413 domain-containing protein [Shewanella glacialipiscicola]MCU7993553.1 DUF413 domain-containing protein [Shewanella glacialipiscicola]MCU8024870.1 DUF413 domain-containing protein [Shewanella glacialipiscicola]
MSEQTFLSANKGSETFNGSATVSFNSQKRFYDDANFPKGFKRSGDFTNKEAELLELHGHAMKNLAEGKTLPCTAEEAQFVEVAKGNIAPSSLLEQIWVKYRRLAMGKPFYAVVGTVHLPATKPEIEIELEADAVFDIEDDVQDEPEPEDKE